MNILKKYLAVIIMKPDFTFAWRRGNFPLGLDFRHAGMVVGMWLAVARSVGEGYLGA